MKTVRTAEEYAEAVKKQRVDDRDCWRLRQ